MMAAEQWRSDASCAGVGASWDALAVDEQIGMCKGCPVAADCLAYGHSIDACGVVYGGRYFPCHARTTTLEGLLP